MGERAHEGGVERERSKREEREERILNAARDLLQKWGYRKTTLDDIAHAARVARGTIYLSWPTREKLFMAVIEREEMELYREIMQRIAEDPEGPTFIGMMKHSMLVTLKNPVARALVLQNTDFLGELVVREYNTNVYQAQLASYMFMLQSLREIGLVRADIELREQAVAVAAAAWGMLLVNSLLPGELHLSDEQMVSVIVTTLKRLLEPDVPPTAEQRRLGEQTLRAYLAQALAVPE